MKIIVNNGTVSVLTDNEITILDSIPAGCYDVSFEKMRGSFLTKREDLCVKEKVYGNHREKANKTFKAFENSTRSLGVILSGKKGIGKTLFVNILAEEAIKKNMPVLIVSANQPGLVQFLGSITQECVVVFDEFEKNFKDDNDDEEDNYSSEQAGLLSMFDGLDSTKKLFLITCNNIGGLNPYVLNRPGRFHYHFKLKNPTTEEVRGYLNDNLNEERKSLIERVVAFSTISEFTYDWLRAICFELNMGSTLEEAIEDLNIESVSYCTYIVSAFIRGEQCTGTISIKLGEGGRESVNLWSNTSNNSYYFYFQNDDLKLADGKVILTGDNYVMSVRSGSYINEDAEDESEQRTVKHSDVTDIQFNIRTEKEKELLF